MIVMIIIINDDRQGFRIEIIINTLSMFVTEIS